MSWRIRLTKELMKSGNPSIVKPSVREALNRKRWNIVRGDKVEIIDRRHPERGKQGIVEAVIRKKGRVIVQGVNMGPKRYKGDPNRGTKGETVMKERSIHYSKVSLLCPVTNRPTRISYSFQQPDGGGEKVRVAKTSGAIIPKPEILKLRKKPVSSIVTPDDTTSEDVWEVTYQKKKKKLNAAN